jgi:hypothetical protein
MPYFLLTFGDASRPPVGAVIVEATSMFRARMTAVERRLTACTGLAVSELFCTDSAVPKVQILHD